MPEIGRRFLFYRPLWGGGGGGRKVSWPLMLRRNGDIDQRLRSPLQKERRRWPLSFSWRFIQIYGTLWRTRLFFFFFFFLFSGSSGRGTVTKYGQLGGRFPFVFLVILRRSQTECRQVITAYVHGRSFHIRLLLFSDFVDRFAEYGVVDFTC